MPRGLDEKQKRTREQSKNKILDYISKNEPCTQTMIVKDSGIKDPKVVRNVLSELEKNNTISSETFHHAVPNQKGRLFYFKIPFSVTILGIMGKEKSFSEISTDYYFGIKQDVPLELQYSHKLDLLNHKYHDIKKFFQNKSDHYEQINEITNFENLMLNNLEFFVYVIKSYYSIMNNSNYQEIYSTYFNAIFKLLIEKMDMFYSTFNELRGNTKMSGPIKTILASMMIEENTRRVAKKMGLSEKSGSKLEHELLNADGSPKIDVINEINMNSIGKKEFGDLIPSGETLMKKWKKLQQEI